MCTRLCTFMLSALTTCTTNVMYRFGTHANKRLVPVREGGRREERGDVPISARNLG